MGGGALALLENRWVRLGAWLVAALLIAVIPQSFEDPDLQIFNYALASAVAAIGLNLLTGFNGQISVGHGAFFGIGAYTTGILVADHGWPHLATFVPAALLCFVIGMAVGLPALRIHGAYLALVTLAMATVFPQLILRYESVTGGGSGLAVPKWNPPDSVDLSREQFHFYLFALVTVAAYLLVRNLIHSRMGRAIIAVRDDETAATVLGIDAAKVKVMTFGLSAALAGIGGCLFAVAFRSLSPTLFGILLSIELLVAVVVGGSATLAGPIIGALFLEWSPEVIDAGDGQVSQILFGVLLIALMRVAPGGLLGGAKRLLVRAMPPPALEPPDDDEPAASAAPPPDTVEGP